MTPPGIKNTVNKNLEKVLTTLTKYYNSHRKYPNVLETRVSLGRGVTIGVVQLVENVILDSGNYAPADFLYILATPSSTLYKKLDHMEEQCRRYGTCKVIEDSSSGYKVLYIKLNSLHRDIKAKLASLLDEIIEGEIVGFEVRLISSSEGSFSKLNIDTIDNIYAVELRPIQIKFDEST